MLRQAFGQQALEGVLPNVSWTIDKTGLLMDGSVLYVEDVGNMVGGMIAHLDECVKELGLSTVVKSVGEALGHHNLHDSHTEEKKESRAWPHAAGMWHNS